MYAFLDDIHIHTIKTILMDGRLRLNGAVYSMKWDDIQLGWFGQSKSVSDSKLWTTIVGGKGDYDAIDKQIDVLKVEIKNTDNLKECERIQERITRLASGVAVIRVGASTEIEMIEKKHRIEDALEAVRSAQQQGVIAGGGASLAKISREL